MKDQFSVTFLLWIFLICPNLCYSETTTKLLEAADKCSFL